MLQGIDHYIKEQLYKTRRKKIHYVHMDIGASDLNKSVNSIIDKLKSELNLTIKPCWEIKSTKQYPVDRLVIVSLSTIRKCGVRYFYTKRFDLLNTRENIIISRTNMVT